MERMLCVISLITDVEENKRFTPHIKGRERGRNQYSSSQANMANEDHTGYKNGYEFLNVQLMFYS
jgi:hypothetical protein